MLLDEFIDALADLKRGKPHGYLFATAPNQTHRALCLKQMREDEALLDLVELIKDMEKVSTWTCLVKLESSSEAKRSI